MAGKVLTKAASLLRRKKYTQVIRMLEPQVFRFRQNPRYYYILGTSYLYTGDIAGASTYIKRVVQLQPDNVRAQLCLAAINLKQNLNQKAIELWLDVLHVDEKNRIARKGLNLLKESAGNPELLDAFLNTDKFYQLVPEGGSKIYIPVAAGVIVIFIVPLILYFLPTMKERIESKPGRSEDVSSIGIDPISEVIDLEGNFVYVLTEDEVIENLQRAKVLFDEYKDNQAQVVINRLKNSNASQDIKEKALLIESYLSVPTFLDFGTNYTYTEVASEPVLYRGCYVRWKGKISNLRITEESISFDFLVGYHDNRVVEGIAPVTFDFAVTVEPGQAVELIGEIQPIDGIISLEGVSLRPLADRE